MDDTITGFVHLDKIAAEIGENAGICDADYAFQRAAAQMIYDLRNALEDAEANVARLTKMVDWLAQVLTGYGDENEEMSAEDWEQSARRAVAAGEE